MQKDKVRCFKIRITKCYSVGKYLQKMSIFVQLHKTTNPMYNRPWRSK